MAARALRVAPSAVTKRLAALEADGRERRPDPAGPIRLAATFGFGRLWLGPALADFQARHPAVAVQLQLTEQLPDLAVDGFDGAIWLWNAPGHRAAEWVSRRLPPPPPGGAGARPAPPPRPPAAGAGGGPRLPAGPWRAAFADRPGGPRLPGGARKRWWTGTAV